MSSSHTRRAYRFGACCLALSIAAGISSAQQNRYSSPNISAANLRPATVERPQPPRPLTPELRGDIYMARKMYREAIDAYREGSPNSAVLANKIGIAFHQLLQFHLAKKYYERAIKLDSKYPEAINNLGTIYYGEKKYGRAIRFYKRALKCYGERPPASVYSNLGAAYFSKRNYKRAVEYYSDALRIDPNVFEHHSNVGTLMQERTIAERALFHLYLAKIYAKSGARRYALIYLRKALEEGVKDRKDIPTMPEFASLKKDPAFLQLLAENPKPL